MSLTTPVPSNVVSVAPTSPLYDVHDIATDGILDVTARALLLDPGQPFFVPDHIVPRAGLEAERYFRRTRSTDGTVYLWMARTSGPGTGPGWSGLRFDAIPNMTPAPSD